MKNYHRVLLFLGVLAVSLLATGAVNAGTITIPDYSFETPDLSVGTPYTSAPDGSDMAPWSGAGAAIYNVAGYYGPFGEGNVTNPLGAQCGYIGNQLSMRPNLYQALTDTFKAGSEYHLTVGATLYQGGGVGINPNQVLSLQLGYWSGAPDGQTGPTIVAERQLVLGDLLEGTLTDFTLNTTAISGDAVDKNIVIYFARAAGAPTGRQYSLDNVRLTETSTPEPGTLVLLATGLMGLVAYAWRKRK
jgi:hypothetical protein